MQVLLTRKHSFNLQHNMEKIQAFYLLNYLKLIKGLDFCHLIKFKWFYQLGGTAGNIIFYLHTQRSNT